MDETEINDLFGELDLISNKDTECIKCCENEENYIKEVPITKYEYMADYYWGIMMAE